eukprot:m.233942 g.233942  ORF g.233942 m.233942 type:complete len:341 (+) comp26512_c0_seq2:109-1131(+)
MSDEEDIIDGEEEDQEQEQTIVDKPLDAAQVAQGLSLLCKTGSGLEHAFVRFDMPKKGLTEVECLKDFKFLRYVNVAENHLSTLKVFEAMPELLTLNASSNRLTSAELASAPFLQELVVSKNQIASLAGIAHPLLTKLVLAENKILDASMLQAQSVPSLSHLDLTGNLFESISSLALPLLTHLYLANNNLTNLAGLDKLPNLQHLHLRGNKIEALQGAPQGCKLKYLNLRENQVDDVQQLKHLRPLTQLTALVLSDNPVADSGEYRVEALVACRNLERLDKDPYEEEERAEADEVFLAREAEQRALEAEQREQQGKEETLKDEEEGETENDEPEETGEDE